MTNTNFPKNVLAGIIENTKESMEHPSQRSGYGLLSKTMSPSDLAEFTYMALCRCAIAADGVYGPEDRVEVYDNKNALPWELGPEGTLSMNHLGDNGPFDVVPTREYPLAAAITVFLDEGFGDNYREGQMRSKYSKATWGALNDIISKNQEAKRALKVLRAAYALNHAEASAAKARLNAYLMVWPTGDLNELAKGDDEAVKAYLALTPDKQIEALILLEEAHRINGLKVGKFVNHPLLGKGFKLNSSDNLGREEGGAEIRDFHSFAEVEEYLAKRAKRHLELLKNPLAALEDAKKLPTAALAEVANIVINSHPQPNATSENSQERLAWVLVQKEAGATPIELSEVFMSLEKEHKIFLLSFQLGFYNQILLLQKRSK